MNEQHCSNGPVSSLPGIMFNPEEGAICDEHQDRAAAKKIQGETDSFGCEYLYVCQECFDKFKQEMQTPHSERCEWCGTMTTNAAPYRDIDEGSSGRVYRVCQECRIRDRESFEEENDDYY